MSVFTLLIIVAMIISTINEVATKRRQGQQGPGAPPHPGRRPPTGERAGAEGDGEARGEDPLRVRMPRTTSRAEEGAHVLIPDDLWAILTGEERPSTRAPEPVSQEPVDPEEPGPDWEWAAEEDWSPRPEVLAETEEDGGLEPEPQEVRGWEERPLEVRPIPVRDREPEIVSLEDSIPSVEERHEAFHRFIDASYDDVGRAAVRAPDAARRRSLRRAIIIKEVLGPPKGLEDPF